MTRVRSTSSGKRQTGLTLLIALIALVAISLSGIALIRMVDTSVLIAGNLAFKQTAVQAGDAGTEAAIAWLDAHSDALDSDTAASGYYASWRTGCDLLGNRTAATNDDVVWTSGSAPKANCGMVAAGIDASRLPDGYAATYVINRMCDSDGLPNNSGVSCSVYIPPGFVCGGKSKAGPHYNDTSGESSSGCSGQFYRVTTRVTGPRNTESFVQTVIGL